MKMKNAILVAGTGRVINIGDYIQALAASQFLPSADLFIEREKLKDYDGEECRMIMNGWYMHDPSQWPPSPEIHPLFVAVHINSSAAPRLLSEGGVAYLKKHAPIGCRDLYTERMLQERGVESYFSGCLTLTLGKKYKAAHRDGTCCFVDPYYITPKTVTAALKNLFYLLSHWKAVDMVAGKFPKHGGWLRKRLDLVTFYREYSRVFTKETLLEAEYICQQNEDYARLFPSDTERLAEAERLVGKYAQASLVVTSRIHCALPCLGLGTPVIYTEDMAQPEASSCRLGGLRELFNVMKWNRGRLEKDFFHEGKISVRNCPRNKSGWERLASELSARCENFFR